MITFKQANKLGEQQIDVLKNGRVIGHIAQVLSGVYAYRRGGSRLPAVTAQTIDALKRKVESLEH